MKTKDARALPATAQEAIRIKAVKAGLSGKSQLEVAALFGVIRQALGKWIMRFRHQGQSALKALKMCKISC